MPANLTILPSHPEAADFRRVFGTLDSIPIISHLPSRGDFPDAKGAEYYRLDLTKLTLDQRARLVAYLADKFNAAPDEVETELKRVGFPIRAEGVAVAIPMRLLI